MTRQPMPCRALRAAAIVIVIAVAGTFALAGCGGNADAGLAGDGAPGLDVSRLVDIGGGRAMYLECRGTGSPTVVLISGKGNGAADWSEILDPADPAHDADYDALAWGQGDLHKDASAVFPSVSRFTRVCAYDRPGVRLDGPGVSTPVAQPHRADRDADDLHRLLTAARETGPFVLVAHSYGGLIATLFAQTWPGEVSGLVMADAATPLVRQVVSADAVAKWDAVNRVSSPQAPEAVLLLDAFASIDASPAPRELPAVVLSSDKPWQPPSAPKESDPAGGVTFDDWRASQQLLATALYARLVTATKSGHNVYAYAPRLVTETIREVVASARASAAAQGDRSTSPNTIAFNDGGRTHTTQMKENGP